MTAVCAYPAQRGCRAPALVGGEAVRTDILNELLRLRRHYQRLERAIRAYLDARDSVDPEGERIARERLDEILKEEWP